MKWHCVVCALLACGTLSACKKANVSTPSAEKPAEVAHHVDEQSLNTITLTPKAHDRLGIKLVEAKLESVQSKRTVAGEVVIPPGMSITVTSPLAGTLLPPETGSVPVPGDNLAQGDPIFRFQPLLTPERDVLTPSERITVAQTRATIATAQLEAERQMGAAKIEVEAAQLAYDRAENLLRAKAGSQRTFDEASARLRLAQEAEKTAAARHEFLAAIELDEKAGQLTSRTIAAPAAGILQTLSAAAGQTVASGDALFSIVNMDRVWVRVPVYIGDWRQIDVSAGVAISEFGASSDAQPRKGTYVAAPPSANAIATTVDVFYELENDNHQLYPGQKVSVTLPLQKAEKRLVVPYAAIVLDIHGGAWVYEEQTPLSYARRRVSVLNVDNGAAILERGLEPGRKVVTDGAAELFGTEFGAGH